MKHIQLIYYSSEGDIGFQVGSSYYEYKLDTGYLQQVVDLKKRRKPGKAFNLVKKRGTLKRKEKMMQLRRETEMEEKIEDALSKVVAKNLERIQEVRDGDFYNSIPKEIREEGIKVLDFCEFITQWYAHRSQGELETIIFLLVSVFMKNPVSFQRIAEKVRMALSEEVLLAKVEQVRGGIHGRAD